MGFLRTIYVEKSGEVKQPEGAPIFRFTTHHVRELFEHFLPKQFVLDKAEQITIHCGPRPTREHHYHSYGASSALYVEDFDFAAYFKMSPEEREEAILKVIEGALKEVGSAHGANCDVISQTAIKVRMSGFRAEIAVKKLSKTTSDRKLKVEVIRALNREEGESWRARVIDRHGNGLISEWIVKPPGHLDRTSHFTISQWSGSEFQIVYKRLNQIKFRINVEKYIETTS